MSQQIRIGQVRAVSVEHSWELTATVHIRLKSASPSTTLPLEDLITCIKEYSPFINRASGLQLVVHVIQDGTRLPSKAVYGDIPRSLAKAFCEAALWKQLELDVTPRFSDAIPPMTPCQFIVEIRHASNIDVPEKRRLHRLPVGSSAADLRPPEGIAWLGLEEIVLELDYSYVAKELEQRSEDDDVRAGQLDQSLRRVGFGLKGPEDEPTHEDDVVLHRRHSLDDSPLPIEDDELVVWKIDTFPMSGLCSPPDGIVGERPRLGAQERSITARGALELADAAFRSIVRPKPAKLAIGIWLPQVDLELDLATLAPTLWQPRYAKAMNERICFLPTITHALSTGLLHRVQSVSLRTKLQALQSQAEDTFRGPDPTIPAANPLSRLLLAKLWQLVQHGVWNGDASQSLKPLSIMPAAEVEDEPADLTSLERIRMSIRDMMSQRQLQADAGPTLATAPISPVLQGLGLLSASQLTGWDGGLLAQPVFSVLTQVSCSSLGAQAHCWEQDEFVGFEDMLDDDDDFLFSEGGDNDSLLEDEEPYKVGFEPRAQCNMDDSILLESQVGNEGGEHPTLRTELDDMEISRPMQQDEDEYDDRALFSYRGFERGLRDMDRESLLQDWDLDDTPPTSQESTSTVYSAQQEYITSRSMRATRSPTLESSKLEEGLSGMLSIVVDEVMHDFNDEDDLLEDSEDENILAF